MVNPNPKSWFQLCNPSLLSIYFLPTFLIVVNLAIKKGFFLKYKLQLLSVIIILHMSYQINDWNIFLFVWVFFVVVCFYIFFTLFFLKNTLCETYVTLINMLLLGNDINCWHSNYNNKKNSCFKILSILYLFKIYMENKTVALIN